MGGVTGRSDDNGIVKKLNECLDNANAGIQYKIGSSLKKFENFLSKKNKLDFKDFDDLKGVLFNNINEEFNNLKTNLINSYLNKNNNIKSISKEVYIKNKEIKNSRSHQNNGCSVKSINDNKNQIQQALDFFTSRDIQEENKEITRNFQKESFKYENYNENVENEGIAHFFREVAKISRVAFNSSNLLLKYMYEKYEKNDKKIITSPDEAQNIKQFSSWIKEKEKKDTKMIYENFLKEQNQNLYNVEENSKEKIFYDLYLKLSILYFHCKISFPLVEISFKSENNYNPEKMIDFLNNGKKDRKINFVILPSLYSNGNYIENGKTFVFTYYDKTFRFENSDLDLDILLNRNTFSIPSFLNDLKLILSYETHGHSTFVIVNTNYKISENVKCSYDFLYRHKNSTNYQRTRLDTNIFEIPPNCEVTECSLIIGNRRIIKKLYD